MRISRTQWAFWRGEFTWEEAKRLPPRYLLILKGRSGRFGMSVWTLEYLAQRCGVTKERVRQMEAKAGGMLYYRDKIPARML